MTKHLTLLLFIGLALGQVNVKSRHNLKPFEIIGDGSFNVTSFLISGYWDCVNDDCELVMIWKERFSAKPAMEHTFEKIEILIEGLNTVINHLATNPFNGMALTIKENLCLQVCIFTVLRQGSLGKLRR